MSEPLHNSSPPEAEQAAKRKHDPYKALRYRNFRFLFIGMLLASIGDSMLNVAVGWEIYERTGSELALGFVGLAMIMPVFLFTLPAGQLADQGRRKAIVLIALSVHFIAVGALGLCSYANTSIVLIYGCLVVMGTAVAFNNPASSALMSQMVPEEAFESAATWSSSAWQLASVLGPGCGGLLIAVAHSALPIYIINTLAVLINICLISLTRPAPRKVSEKKERPSLRSLGEGVRFLRQTPVMLAAITLDLFAVLLGGATTLMPVFAKDILQVGPSGLGWLQAAPSVGALCVTFIIAHRPFKKAGRALLLAVAGFGLVTIVFGLSRSFWLSLLMLFLLGGLDCVSVVIRSTLLLARTPDEMRGRVSAVNELFISASNQLGGFESGAAAQYLGPVPAVVFGGIGTMIVVGIVSLVWPEIRKLGTLRPNEEALTEASEEERERLMNA
uniref:MFS transporter n=1 Tax=Thermosporothrix sp. COM3 TaxID=2490863 RepID=A0A455SKS9_9CHLR|nr:MFS transporter [Thermosporothrix sp. COM3]